MDKSGSSSSSSTLSIILPDKLWLGKLSRAFRMGCFEIISFIPIQSEPAIGNSMIKISSINPEEILSEIKKHPSLVSVKVMERGPTHITVETQTRDQFLLRSLIQNKILVKLPVGIEVGRAKFNIYAQRENIDNFIEDLNKKGMKVEITNLGQYKDNFLKLSLTERQLFIYRKARETGYYESPRKINLTDLAEYLGLAKSSLSSMLQRIHKKLLGGNYK